MGVRGRCGGRNRRQPSPLAPSGLSILGTWRQTGELSLKEVGRRLLAVVAAVAPPRLRTVGGPVAASRAMPLSTLPAVGTVATQVTSWRMGGRRCRHA